MDFNLAKHSIKDKTAELSLVVATPGSEENVILVGRPATDANIPFRDARRTWALQASSRSRSQAKAAASMLEDENKFVELFAKYVICDWKNVLVSSDKSDKYVKVPCTVEARTAFLTQLKNHDPDEWGVVKNFFMDADNFREKAGEIDEAAVAKN